MDSIKCNKCGSSLSVDAKFCSRCGTAIEAGERPTNAASNPNSRNRWFALLGIIVVGGVVAAIEEPDVFGSFSRGFASGLGLSQLKLSVELTVPPGFNRIPHQGSVKITNLAEEPVKLISVSINHRKDVECSFGPNASPIRKPLLNQGENVTLGTGSTLMGECGAIVSVLIETDKGSNEFAIAQ